MNAIDLLRDPLRSHPPKTHGLCPLCGHYGDDCTGTRAADYLAAHDRRQAERADKAKR